MPDPRMNPSQQQQHLLNLLILSIRLHKVTTRPFLRWKCNVPQIPLPVPVPIQVPVQRRLQHVVELISSAMHRASVAPNAPAPSCKQHKLNNNKTHNRLITFVSLFSVSLSLFSCVEESSSACWCRCPLPTIVMVMASRCLRLKDNATLSMITHF